MAKLPHYNYSLLSSHLSPLPLSLLFFSPAFQQHPWHLLYLAPQDSSRLEGVICSWLQRESSRITQSRMVKVTRLLGITGPVLLLPTVSCFLMSPGHTALTGRLLSNLPITPPVVQFGTLRLGNSKLSLIQTPLYPFSVQTSNSIWAPAGFCHFYSQLLRGDQLPVSNNIQHRALHLKTPEMVDKEKPLCRGELGICFTMKETNKTLGLSPNSFPIC